MSCFWGCAKKVCIGVQHINTRWVSYHRENDDYGDWLPSTNAAFRCKRCGDISTQTLHGSGSLTVEQINGEEA